MKKSFFFIAVAFTVTQLWSQDKVMSPTEDKNYRIPLIGETAPSFTAESTNGFINFPEDFGRNWKILFSHPQDFTPVCSSEILELAVLQDKFEELGVRIAVVSTDPVSMHRQWVKAMEKIDFKDGKKVKIKFPIVDDENVAISRRYGMLQSNSNSTRTVRGVFVIDPDNVIQAFYFYPNSVGRSTDELIRMISALQTTNSEAVVTPANWQVGKDLLVPFNPVRDLSKPHVAPEGYYNLAWFMWYKKGDL